MSPPRWYRVYSYRGERLMVQAVDEGDAKARARARWGRAGLYTSNHEAREATAAEVAEHQASVAAMERLAWG